MWKAPMEKVMLDYDYWGKDTQLFVARDGPKWGPDINVEVIVGFTTTDKKKYLLRTKNVPIKMSV